MFTISPESKPLVHDKAMRHEMMASPTESLGEEGSSNATGSGGSAGNSTGGSQTQSPTLGMRTISTSGPDSQVGTPASSTLGNPGLVVGSLSSTNGSSGTGGRSSPKDCSESTIRCLLCSEVFNNPKVLACFHTFCKPCLDKLIDSPGKILCPTCNGETTLCPNMGVESLLTDYAILNMQDAAAIEANNNHIICTGCKSKDLNAVAYCVDCGNYLCNNCVMAHQYMHCFEGHQVKNLDEFEGNIGRTVERPVKCITHKMENIRYFCYTCNLAICQVCMQSDHPRGQHQWEPIADVGKQLICEMRELLNMTTMKQRAVVQSFKSYDSNVQKLGNTYEQSRRQIDETSNFLLQLLEEQRQQTLRELETAYQTRQMSLTMCDKKMQATLEKLSQTIVFTGRLLDNACPAEVLVFKKLLDARLKAMLSMNPDPNVQSKVEMEFVSNPVHARSAIRSIFGFVRHTADVATPPKLAPIGRPPSQGSMNSGGFMGNGQLNAMSGPMSLPTGLGMGLGGGSNVVMPPTSMANAFGSGMPPGGMGGMMGGLGSGNFMDESPNFGSLCSPHSQQTANHQQPIGSSRQSDNGSGSVFCFDSFNSTGGTTHPDVAASVFNTSQRSIFSSSAADSSSQYERWSNGGNETISYPSGVEPFYGTGSLPDRMSPSELAMKVANGQTSPAEIIDLTAKLNLAHNVGASLAGFPPKSQIKRQKMIYHCKFGEFGVMEGQFTEPSGVAVNKEGDIIVADTNNHRIQVFDKEGRFKFHFGECGKRDGQLLYPNRVAVNKMTGEVVVTERSPTHQIQVYNPYGQFLRKFGANILQHPRGVCVDNKGRVIIVECKVMRVLIFDLSGNILQKFGCSKFLEFPNGVCCNDKEEIFISDNRAHCIKVFSYEGSYLRQVGGEGVTNYPIGVGINHLGQIVVADNHNNFNVTIFEQDGTLVNALESKVKHAQCFDVCLMDDCSIVLASKDYRLYIYRYSQLPVLGAI